MYCKHCGKEIADDSKFCQHCGGEQDFNSKPINKSVWIIYFIWFLSNLYMLIDGGTGNKAGYYFYPFTAHYDFYTFYNWDMDFYDFSEFFVFVFVVPAFLYVIYRRYNKQIDKAINTLLKK